MCSTSSILQKKGCKSDFVDILGNVDYKYFLKIYLDIFHKEKKCVNHGTNLIVC
jgi:hypothetical protein